MKEKIKKEYLGRTRKLLETKLCSRNLIKGINTWTVRIIRYSGPFLKWTGEFKQMDQRTRKLITMHKAGTPKITLTDYMSQEKKQKKDFPALTAEASMQWHEDYIQKRWGRLITATRNNTNNTRTYRMTISRKQIWEEKQLYGRFKRPISNITRENLDLAKKGKP